MKRMLKYERPEDSVVYDFMRRVAEKLDTPNKDPTWFDGAKNFVFGPGTPIQAPGVLVKIYCGRDLNVCIKEMPVNLEANRKGTNGKWVGISQADVYDVNITYHSIEKLCKEFGLTPIGGEYMYAKAL